MVFMNVIMDGMFFLSGEIDDIGGQFGVEFPRISVFIPAVLIVYTVSDVGSLLYFGDKAAFANGVYRSGGDKKAIPLFYLFHIEQAGQGVLPEMFQVFFFIGVFLKAQN